MNNKKTYCNACSWELDEWEALHPSLHKDNSVDFNLAKDYCEDHERIYKDKCKPVWCRSCKHLKLYQITVTEKSKTIDLKRK